MLCVGGGLLLLTLVALILFAVRKRRAMENNVMVRKGFLFPSPACVLY